jgi:hypothetical protein
LELNAVPANVDLIDVNALIHSVTGQMQAQAAQRQIDLAGRASMPVLSAPIRGCFARSCSI